MQPIETRTSDPEPPNGRENLTIAESRSAVKYVLSGLKRWQVVPVFIIAVYLFLGIFGPTLAPFGPNRGTISNRFCPPLGIDALTIAQYPASRSTDCGTAHILGTDQIGRDVFSRLLHGARTSLWVVGPSVIIGTMIGTLIGAVINGWSPKPRLIAYLIASVTIVPFGIFLLSEPQALYVFGMFRSARDSVDPSALTAFSNATAVITLALVAIAYRYDNKCRSSWSEGVDAEFPVHSFCRKLHTQIVALAPWTVLAAIASAALVFLRSGSSFVQTAAITWNYEPDHLFEHVGMLSPFVPMVLIPIALVSLATWWVTHRLLIRFNSTPKSFGSKNRNVEVSTEEPSSASFVLTEEDSDRDGIEAFENGDPKTSIGSVRRLKRLRWVLIIVAVVTAIVVIRFGTAEAVPIVRELAQDWNGDYQSALAYSVQGRRDASECANELSSRLRTLRSLSPEQLDIEASQRCLDLYFQYRNAPTHRLTFDHALQFVPQTLTLALLASIVSAVIWTATSTSTSVARRVVGGCVVLVALIGLTMTFGYTAWLLAVSRWFDPVNLVLSDQGLAISRAVIVVRDFSVALGISYLSIAIAKPPTRFEKAIPKVESLYKWTTYLVPCVLLTSGLLIAFHYRFPAFLLFLDDALGVIPNPSEEQTYISTSSLFRNWLWTYWFALIGYAAIVFAFFYAAISGFRLFANENRDSDTDETPINPAASTLHRSS